MLFWYPTPLTQARTRVRLVFVRRLAAYLGSHLKARHSVLRTNSRVLAVLVGSLPLSIESMLTPSGFVGTGYALAGVDSPRSVLIRCSITCYS